jgi:transcriptional regulator with XRE-family HTH domain
MMAERADRPGSVTDRLRQAIGGSGLSFSRLARLAGVAQPQLSRFMAGERDLTLAVAARVCRVLGLDLVQSAPVLETPLEAPEPTPRKRREEGAPPPPFSEARGRGKRVDLIAEGGGGAGQEAAPSVPSQQQAAASPAAEMSEEAAGAGKKKAGPGRRRKAE